MGRNAAYLNAGGLNADRRGMNDSSKALLQLNNEQGNIGRKNGT